MEAKHIDMTGMRFGRVVCQEWAGRDDNGMSIWKVRCDCGVVFNAYRSNLVNGTTRSCGCLRRDQIRRRNFERFHATNV